MAKPNVVPNKSLKKADLANVINTLGFPPSSYQQSVFDYYLNSDSPKVSPFLLINAVAGSAKTTSILQAVQFIPNRKARTSFLAFNNHISKEIKSKLDEFGISTVFPGQSGLSVQTFNAMGFRSVLLVRPDTTLIPENNTKIRAIFQQFKSQPLEESKKEKYKELQDFVIDLVNLARNFGLAPKDIDGYTLRPVELDTIKNLKAIVEEYDLRPENDIDVAIAVAKRKIVDAAIAKGKDPTKVKFDPKTLPTQADLDAIMIKELKLARRVLRSSLRQSIFGYVNPPKPDCPYEDAGKKLIDFTDQVYLVAVDPATRLPQIDYLLVDEAQDTNAIRLRIIERLIENNPNIRITCVGDKKQAIYAWSGADDNSIDTIKRTLQKYAPVTELTLPISYRCPQEIVNLAKHYVPYIEASPVADIGKVDTVTTYNKFTFMQPDTAVLCRFNAPLITLAMELLARQVPILIVGREIHKGLLKLVSKSKAKTVKELRDTLQIMLREPNLKEGYEDKIQCVMAIVSNLKPTDPTDRVVNLIESVFSDRNSKNAVKLSSIHRVKGMEFNNVFILDTPFNPILLKSKQEDNLKYVALTRTKKWLRFIKPDSWKDYGVLESPEPRYHYDMAISELIAKDRKRELSKKIASGTKAVKSGVVSKGLTKGIGKLPTKIDPETGEVLEGNNYSNLSGQALVDFVDSYRTKARMEPVPSIASRLVKTPKPVEPVSVGSLLIYPSTTFADANDDNANNADEDDDEDGN